MSVQEIMRDRKSQLERNFYLLENGRMDQAVQAQKLKLTRPPWNLPDRHRPTATAGTQLKLKGDLSTLKAAFATSPLTSRERLNIVGAKNFVWPRPVGPDRFNVPRRITIQFLNQLESINRHRLLNEQPVLSSDEVARQVIEWMAKFNERTPLYHQIYHQASILAGILTAYPV